jgi:hypothetical protein
VAPGLFPPLKRGDQINWRIPGKQKHHGAVKLLASSTFFMRKSRKSFSFDSGNAYFCSPLSAFTAV